MKPVLLFSLSLLLLLGQVFCPINNAIAANDTDEATPSFAPSFKKISPPSVTLAPASSNSDGATFRVNTNQIAPLQGGVYDWSALSGTAQEDLLRGNVDTMVRTSPALAGSASKNVPPEVFKAWLGKAHQRFALNLDKMSNESIIEVKGQFDDAGKTLRAFGINYKRVSPDQIVNMPLDNTRVVIINCAGTLSRRAFQKIRDFVMQGGYLLTTDWTLNNFVEGAFPGYIEWDHSSNRKAVYDAEVAEIDPVLFSHTVTNALWKMDNGCHLARSIRPGTVRILARSTQLAQEDRNGAGQGGLAFLFPFGRGYVLHLVAHFENNSGLGILFPNTLPDAAPVIGISLRQAIAANFIVSALEGERIPTKANQGF